MTADQHQLGMPAHGAYSHDPLPRSKFAKDDLHGRIQFETWVDATPVIRLKWMIQITKLFSLLDGSPLLFISIFGDEVSPPDFGYQRSVMTCWVMPALPFCSICHA